METWCLFGKKYKELQSSFLLRCCFCFGFRNLWFLWKILEFCFEVYCLLMLLLLLPSWLLGNIIDLLFLVVVIACRHCYCCYYFFHGFGLVAPSLLPLPSWLWSWSFGIIIVVVVSFVVMVIWCHRCWCYFFHGHGHLVPSGALSKVPSPLLLLFPLWLCSPSGIVSFVQWTTMYCSSFMFCVSVGRCMWSTSWCFSFDVWPHSHK